MILVSFMELYFIRFKVFQLIIAIDQIQIKNSLKFLQNMPKT